MFWPRGACRHNSYARHYVYKLYAYENDLFMGSEAYQGEISLAAEKPRYYYSKESNSTEHNNRRFIDLTNSYYIQAIQTPAKTQSDALYNSVNGRGKNRARLDTVQYSTIGSRPINWSIAMDVCIHKLLSGVSFPFLFAGRSSSATIEAHRPLRKEPKQQLIV